jgi:hypothetical protein
MARFLPRTPAPVVVIVIVLGTHNNLSSRSTRIRPALWLC